MGQPEKPENAELNTPKPAFTNFVKSNKIPKNPTKEQLNLYNELKKVSSITIPNKPTNKVLKAYDVDGLETYIKKFQKYFKLYIENKKINKNIKIKKKKK